ncbi:TPA: hypothetical protein MIT55_08600 [Klebsiella pneumoniae]|nr:hypothetical protein [Klebsiella pneumoniae]HBX5439249.1 hypothetical protein [Klebsiella pneumoniae]HBY4095700.1 hypothetical protein [Klebsiella pneumoniae]
MVVPDGGINALSGLRFVRPVVNLTTCATETAGAGRSPGVQGAAATGRPLCAPCAIRDIAQKKYRERNLPGHNTGVVALLSAVRAGKIPDGGAWCLIRTTKASKPGLNLQRRGPLTPARG